MSDFDTGADDFGSGGGVLESTPSISYINEAGVPEETVEVIRGMREVASVIEKWSRSLAEGEINSPTADLFNRGRWAGATHKFAVMDQVSRAVEHDDILSTLADVMEALAFQKTRFEMLDDDQEDMWNQWAADVDLDTRLREQFRELFKVSQFYVGLWWERKVYSVRDKSIEDVLDDVKQQMDEKEQEEHERELERYEALPADQKFNPETGGGMQKPLPPLPVRTKGRGNRTRKKKFPVLVPTAITIFEPTKVVPVGNMMFNRERFAYIASDGENQAFTQVMAGDVVDDQVLRLMERKYEPPKGEAQYLESMGINPQRLWLFKADAVFRHTLTKAPYERFAPIRLEAILPILDMKNHLRASDRASLVGNTNFIVVIKKGTDKLPAKAAEIQNLQEQAKVVARMPILVGDHRLSVEIVSPALDNTLIESRWEVLDSRLVFKALGTFQPTIQGGMGSSSGVSEMSRVVARGIENRRHEMIRTLEKAIFKAVVDKNEGVLDERPTLAFTPKRVSLDFNTDVIQAILKLRDRGDLSRETMLEEVDFDQDVEVLRRAREKAIYDETFTSSVPHGSPEANPFQANAGNPALLNGGGQNGPAAAKPAVPPGKQPTKGVAPSVSGNAGGRPKGTRDSAPRKTT